MHVPISALALPTPCTAARTPAAGEYAAGARLLFPSECYGSSLLWRVSPRYCGVGKTSTDRSAQAAIFNLAAELLVNVTAFAHALGLR